MRIIGGHDYYDGAVPFDTDKGRVFLRDRREAVVSRDYPDFRLAPNRSKWSREVSPLEIIFCGVRYRGIHILLTRSIDQFREEHFFWSAPKLREFLTERGMAFDPQPKVRWRRSGIHAEDLDAYFEPKRVEDKLFDRLIRDKILIAIAPIPVRYHRDDDPWVVNSDGLKDRHFSSVMPPWEAYQELDMFLGTILVGDEDRMVKVSDATKLAKYGFDRWSFKNPVHRAKPRGKSA